MDGGRTAKDYLSYFGSEGVDTLRNNWIKMFGQNNRYIQPVGAFYVSGKRRVHVKPDDKNG